ncbi:MAG: murein DD-endopeptidase MepM/ murein hydrolase activator NlpD [Flavobacterium sp.]|jgi:murein DD-endopeptidase MepM/ murein hydrolase activator NlpD
MSQLSSLLAEIESAKVILPQISYSDYIAIDLSTSSKLLENTILESANDLENIIYSYVSKKEAKIAFGGYLEERDLYKRSELFDAEDADSRNIHLGIDIWEKSGSTIHAALDGKVHSFKNNEGLGNYGPTIILEHTIDDVDFYTLYGHLSKDSISNLEINQVFKKGDRIGYLGSAEVNGDYAPHLHFQIIENIRDYNGDYPGVCSKTNADFYRENCPNPDLLLKIIKK